MSGTDAVAAAAAAAAAASGGRGTWRVSAADESSDVGTWLEMSTDMASSSIGELAVYEVGDVDDITQPDAKQNDATFSQLLGRLLSIDVFGTTVTITMTVAKGRRLNLGQSVHQAGMPFCDDGLVPVDYVRRVVDIVTRAGGGSGVAMGEASKAHAVGGTVGDDVPASLFGEYAPIMPRAGIPNPGPVTRASHIRYAQQLPNGYPYQLRQHPYQLRHHPQAVTLWGQWPAGAATAREVPVAHPHSHPNPHPQHHHPQPFPAIAQVLPQATASVMGGGGGIAESAMQRLLMAQMYPQHHLNTRHR
ncbi:unnamed protein product [Vitrella brassicaformis CCMP3155]|uniref:Uncharacterized protein n=1 Tax=Vitrella brassicaformis (strain CCMP3155) TaxID=1169540 RepID=A0A0G4H215_VITBC|nr:unnamed protein product [Vitrella brassicaformis CCMP3155]|eukprot:CEM37574.1 unnamed protein product [Vitrella brassicaformis CCMP3155]